MHPTRRQQLWDRTRTLGLLGHVLVNGASTPGLERQLDAIDCAAPTEADPNLQALGRMVLLACKVTAAEADECVGAAEAYGMVVDEVVALLERIDPGPYADVVERLRRTI